MRPATGQAWLNSGVAADGSLDALPAGPDVAVSSRQGLHLYVMGWRNGEMTLCDSHVKGPLSDDRGVEKKAGQGRYRLTRTDSATSRAAWPAVICFIRTCRNRKTTPVGGRHKRGFPPPRLEGGCPRQGAQAST